MSLTIDLESVDGICIAIAKGSLSVDELRESAVAMWRRVEGPSVRILWDLRDAKFDLDAAEISDIANTMKRLAASAQPHVAFVVAQDLEFGLLRMYEVFREADGVRTSVFRDSELAIAWLRGESA